MPIIFAIRQKNKFKSAMKPLRFLPNSQKSPGDSSSTNINWVTLAKTFVFGILCIFIGFYVANLRKKASLKWIVPAEYISFLKNTTSVENFIPRESPPKEYKRPYRIGDMVRGFAGKEYHLRHYPNTIASNYLELSKGENNNLEILLSVVDSKKQEMSEKGLYSNGDDPLPNQLVVHLRTGDVIDLSSATVQQMLDSPIPGWYMHCGDAPTSKNKQLS